MGDFVFGSLLSPHQQRNYDIQTKLKKMDDKLDNLAKDVDSLTVGQRRLEATSLYGRDVSRLRFFLSYLVNFLFQNGASLQPANLADEWANNILDLGGDGVAQVCR